MTERRGVFLAVAALIFDLLMVLGLGLAGAPGAGSDGPGLGFGAPIVLALILLRQHDFRTPVRFGVRAAACCLAVVPGTLVVLAFGGFAAAGDAIPWAAATALGLVAGRAAVLEIARRRRALLLRDGDGSPEVRAVLALADAHPEFGLRRAAAEDEDGGLLLVGESRGGEGGPGRALVPAGFPDRIRRFALTGTSRIVADREWPIEGASRRIKRSCDLLAAAPLCLIGLPLALVGAALVLFREGRPVLYRQTRLTERARPFSILKIRTMRRDAESGGEAVWPRADDERITKLGRLLRVLWIDEVPQIWNVLRGDLSLVGPRPERPAFAQVFEKSVPRYTERYRARAGITGLAQAAGYVGNTSIRKRTLCDRIYVRRWSPWFDLRVILMTLRQLVSRTRRPHFDFVPGRDEQIP